MRTFHVNIQSIDTVATGQNLRRLCRDHGIRVVELAEALGVSEQAVYNWFRGDKMPQLELAMALAELFGTSLEKLYLRCGSTHEVER